MDLKPKELTEIKQQVSLVQQSANALVIEDQKGMNQATDVLHNVKEVAKYIEERKKSVTAPLMQALSAARDLFKPRELDLAMAEKTIKAKMLEWKILEDDRIAKEQARIAARVEKGTMKNSTAIGKLEALGEVNAGSQGEVGKSSIREVRKVRVVDEFAVPREYLVLNMSMITEAVIRKGVTIPGVETFLEKSIISR